MCIYYHYIFATGALYVSGIGLISTSLVCAALVNAPDASISCSPGTPLDAIILRFWLGFFPNSPLTPCVVAFGRLRFAFPAAFLAVSYLARSTQSTRIALRSSCFITCPLLFFPRFFRISDLVFR
jgi:hypothetical protein